MLIVAMGILMRMGQAHAAMVTITVHTAIAMITLGMVIVDMTMVKTMIIQHTFIHMSIPAMANADTIMVDTSMDTSTIQVLIM
jgi:hypothetical protein